MRSRFAIVPALAIAVVVLLVVLWAFGPREEKEERTALVSKVGAARPPLPLLKDRALPKAPPPAAVEEQVQVETPSVVEETGPKKERRRVTKLERFLERKRQFEERRARAPARSEADVEVESGLLEDGVGGRAQVAQPSPPRPDSPFDELSDDDRVEIIVALQRLRDSGALRRVAPEDYLRVMEVMPDSQGLQDADRIFREILGMGVGEWLAKYRGGQTFILE